MPRIPVTLPLVLLLAACAMQPPVAPPAPCAAVPLACPACPVCPKVEVPPPPARPFAAARWEDLDGWPETAGLAPTFAAFLQSCATLQKRVIWRDACASARALETRSETDLRAWFETQLQPWQMVKPDGSREGLVTGYYEPLLKGSRVRDMPYLYPIYAVPADLIDVELGELYPELKHMRLRGRIEGRKLVPYYSRAEWDDQAGRRNDGVLLWADDAFDVFFLQIQGSGQVQLDDGSRIRVGYAEQNGHPYHSIGRWLIERGEMKLEQASMQGIKDWAKAHPRRMQELLNANPSYVFFRELPLVSEGPPGALGIPLTAQRSIAVDPRIIPLGAPVWLSTTYPNSEQPLVRLMLAQDTGGAIRGPVRADFFWGSGQEAGAQAGKMRQKGQMWTLLPRAYEPFKESK